VTEGLRIVWDQDTEIVWNRRVADGTYFMALRSPEISAAARAGQFVMIRTGEAMDPLLRRPFSICGSEDGLVQFLYRVVGRGTRLLSDRREGESLAVLGPLGRGFEIPGKDQRSILTAGGMGIAPLLFLARCLASERTSFLVGFGSAGQVIRAEPTGPLNIPIGMATDDGSAGHHGLVTDLLEDALDRRDGERATVFACGPLPMLKAVAAITRARRVPCQVSLEAAMACGLGACQGCAVKAAAGQGRTYWHVCQDGPVFDAIHLDWEAMVWRNNRI